MWGGELVMCSDECLQCCGCEKEGFRQAYERKQAGFIPLGGGGGAAVGFAALAIASRPA